ncbi:hypothetical protein [Frigidibacter mobilis]|uniref:Uncharacterized protein n=1 Tax=Frigidibacter mobilis TaxID=1335048 RepID=A0A159Z5Y2_9RHOB|nr:hypothetical protein [Frigidibacter mobilis]AMY70686.1 hypothetical protein AKL17_3461 [Frigidibacter mobilis]
MSDPMTKVEIEDVLSSIRRLVSEDLGIPLGGPRSEPVRTAAAHHRPLLSAAPAVQSNSPGPEAAKVLPEADEGDSFAAADQSDQAAEQLLETGAVSLGPAAEAAAQPDPLLLTPALRVARPDAASLRASLEETIAELEAAISGSGSEWEPDGSEMPEGQVAGDDLAAELAATISAIEEEGEAADAAHPEERGDAPQAEVEAPIAGMPAEGAVRLVSDTGDARPEGLWSQYPETMEWAAPGDLTDPAESSSGDVVVADEPLREGLELAPAEPESLAIDASPDADIESADRFWAAEAEDLASRELALPAEEASTSAAEAPDWQDDPSADSQPRRLHLAGGLGWGATPPVSDAGRGWLPDESEDGDMLEAEEEPGLFGDAEDAVLDEAALRALVSEIIRQELQGTLGERITRSVRKLVRREIQRALAARDFE